MKKLSSFGVRKEGRGKGGDGYVGEITGIKADISKSNKF
jgi:hypothetical protein